jgi:hypothetical protein
METLWKRNSRSIIPAEAIVLADSKLAESSKHRNPGELILEFERRVYISEQQPLPKIYPQMAFGKHLLGGGTLAEPGGRLGSRS